MKNSEKLQENLEAVDETLNNQGIESISNSIRCLERILSCGEQYEEKLTEEGFIEEVKGIVKEKLHIILENMGYKNIELEIM